MPKPAKTDSVVVSALRARTNFGRLLQRVEDEQRSVVIEKRGTPRAVLMSIRDYVRLAAPEPEVLRILGEESEAQGTDRLSGQQIEKIIRQTRAKRRKNPKHR
jgi:prevent-host-death family protein